MLNVGYIRLVECQLEGPVSQHSPEPFDVLVQYLACLSSKEAHSGLESRLEGLKHLSLQFTCEIVAVQRKLLGHAQCCRQVLQLLWCRFLRGTDVIPAGKVS